MKEEIKALIEYRLQEAKESREEAEILLENGKNRDALNRVYYSMFYATLALLSTKQLSASKHSGVSLFHREFVKTGVISPEVAKFLDVAFDLRSKSDYRDFVMPEESKVREVLRESEVFIRTIESAAKNLVG